MNFQSQKSLEKDFAFSLWSQCSSGLVAGFIKNESPTESTFFRKVLEQRSRTAEIENIQAEAPKTHHNNIRQQSIWKPSDFQTVLTVSLFTTKSTRNQALREIKLAFFWTAQTKRIQKSVTAWFHSKLPRLFPDSEKIYVVSSQLKCDEPGWLWLAD